MKNLNSPQSFILILLFLGLIISPLLIQLTGFKIKAENFENREMAKMPLIPVIKSNDGMKINREVANFIYGFNKYVNDNIPFRNTLFCLFRDIKIYIFSVSPVPDRVVLGENGWFFIGNSNSDVIKEAKGIKVFTEDELKQCVGTITHYNSFLTQKGIKYYFSVAPDKASIYGQFLPIVKSPRPTKLEQLKLELAKRNFQVVDLKEDFILLPEVRLYHKNDSHWNQAGAFLGYLSIMKRIQVDFPYVSILNIKDFIIDTTIIVRGDLTRVLQLKEKEAAIKLTPIQRSQVLQPQKVVVPENCDLGVNGYGQRFICEGKPLKVLIFCDSFFLDIVPYITQSFGETVIISSKMNKEIITFEKPDIVINEIAERDLDKFIDL